MAVGKGDSSSSIMITGREIDNPRRGGVFDHHIGKTTGIDAVGMLVQQHETHSGGGVKLVRLVLVHIRKRRPGLVRQPRHRDLMGERSRHGVGCNAFLDQPRGLTGQ